MCCSKRMAAAASSFPPRGQAGRTFFWRSPRCRREGASCSALAEAVEGDDLGGRAVLVGQWLRSRLRGGQAADRFRLGGRRLREFQGEINRRIGKAAERRQGDRLPLQLLLETQRHRERLFADLEIPELVLQDDRHLFRKALAQTVRDA